MKRGDKRKPIVVPGTIRDGVIEFRPPSVALWPDGEVDITFAQREDTRHARANRYYWGVVLKLMSKESGTPAEDLHELMKMRHNFTFVVDPNGEEIKVAQSTAHKTVAEFSDYLEKVMLDGSEWLGIIFPEPRAEDDWRKK